ncbi:glutamine--fructose-6-phosphate transaminase (isomerizing), partial [Micropruina sp.]|uniref:glutamine--fructose-6-phosphate transaminase (isomerizing) n=1 Tax=Micropruina sp. TaxID=2737536 RepID=UPI0026269916
MCGIIGYVGPRDASKVVVEGLRRMEYRGYDSAGVAVIADGAIDFRKKAGKISNLDAEIAADPIAVSEIGIGHTRWATHGGPTDRNAHPHVSANGRVALIHNGIIENFAPLRAELQAQGIEFRSETDSEVAAQLVGQAVGDGADLADAMRGVCNRLHGAFTLVAIDTAEPGRLVAARRNSPLVVGVGEGENFVASDVAAFIEFTRQAIELGQDQVVDVTRDSVTVTDFDGAPADSHPFEVTWDLSAAEKQGYDWFMRKEIYEQPQAVADTLLGRYNDDGSLKLDELHIPEAELRTIDKIIIVACGTAYYAGMVAKYAIEHWTRIACEVEIASEFRYRDPIITPRTLVVTLSQSGETADTLMAIRHAREQGAKVIAICNTN